MFLISSTSQFKRWRSQSGFGLIELLVSISVLTIVTAVILVRQDSFNSAVLLRNEATQVALDVRLVQLTAVSAADDTGSGGFRSVYGVYFNTNSSVNGVYQIFRDSDSGANQNNFYNTNEEFGLQGILDPRFEVRAIRLDGSDETDVSIVFERPNFDARFFTSGSVEVAAGEAEIDIAVREGTGTGPETLRTVTISSAGQIAVP